MRKSTINEIVAALGEQIETLQNQVHTCRVMVNDLQLRPQREDPLALAEMTDCHIRQLADSHVIKFDADKNGWINLPTARCNGQISQFIRGPKLRNYLLSAALPFAVEITGLVVKGNGGGAKLAVHHNGRALADFDAVNVTDILQIVPAAKAITASEGDRLAAEITQLDPGMKDLWLGIQAFRP